MSLLITPENNYINSWSGTDANMRLYIRSVHGYDTISLEELKPLCVRSGQPMKTQIFVKERVRYIKYVFIKKQF